MVCWSRGDMYTKDEVFSYLDWLEKQHLDQRGLHHQQWHLRIFVTEDVAAHSVTHLCSVIDNINTTKRKNHLLS